MLRNKRGSDSERPAHCDEERPPLATTRESPRTETKTQHRQKLKKIKIKKKTTMRYHLTPVRMGIIRKSTNNMLERVWRKENPLALLVGM